MLCPPVPAGFVSHSSSGYILHAVNSCNQMSGMFYDEKRNNWKMVMAEKK